MKKLLLFLTVAIVALASCKKGDGPGKKHDRLIALLLGKDTLSMYVGETRQVPLTINPTSYHLDSLLWKSSDTTVLSFSSTGLLTAKKLGKSTITVSNLTNTISVSALVTVGPAPIDSLSLGLVAYYPFNNSAADMSGNNYNGTAYNVTSTTNRNGVANSAYSFDGSSSYITVKNVAALNLNGTDFTINAWINIKTYNSSYGSIVIEKRGAGSANGWNFGVAGYGDLNNYVGAFGVLTYSVSGGTDPYIKGRTQIDTNQWHMITTLYNHLTSVQSIYVDGVLDNTRDSIPTPNINNAADVFIGMDNPSASPNGYYFNGKMDELRIYNRALPATQIKDLYTSSK